MIEILVNKKIDCLDMLKAVAASAAEFLGQPEKLTASFGFVAEKQMRALNLSFRGIDKPTDVLSFPNLCLKAPGSLCVPPVTKAAYPLDVDGGGAVFLGDIIICRTIAERQAAEYGHSADREICYLFTHGLLHLFGFDHMADSDKKLMRQAEEEILGNIEREEKKVNIIYERRKGI